MATSNFQPPILLSVDIQQGMVDGDPTWGSRSNPSLESNVQHIFSHWRTQSWPIIHIQHDDLEDPTNIISSHFPKTFAIHPIAAPVPGEPVYVKHTGSAFTDTPLIDELEKLGGKKTRIVLIGLDGAQCINSTARNGKDLGYDDLVVVGDAVATYATREWDGSGRGWEERKEVEAELTHRVALGMLDGYVKIIDTKTLLGELR